MHRCDTFFPVNVTISIFDTLPMVAVTFARASLARPHRIVPPCTAQPDRQGGRVLLTNIICSFHAPLLLTVFKLLLSTNVTAHFLYVTRRPRGRGSMGHSRGSRRFSNLLP